MVKVWWKIALGTDGICGKDKICAVALDFS